MATTRAAIRGVCGQLLGQGQSFTCTGNGDTTSIISTHFEDFALGSNDVFNRQWWVAMTTLNGDANSFEERRVSDYATSGTDMTVSRAFSASTATSDVGELWRIRPSRINDGITRALRWLADSGVHLPVYDESLFVDNLLSNSGMETAGAAPPVIANWTAVGSPTVTQEGTRVWHGSNSAKVVASGATGIIEQNVFTSVNVHEIASKSVKAQARVHATDADQARIRITFDGSTYTSSNYHQGRDEWERLTFTAEVPASASEMTVSFEVNDGYTAYCDDLICWVDRLYRVAVPTSIVGLPRQVWMETLENAAPRSQRWEPVTRWNAPVSGRRLRILGRGVPTAPTSENSSIEISNNLIDLVANKALEIACSAEASSLPRNTEAEYWEQQAIKFATETQRMMPSVKVDLPSIHIPDGWHTSSNGETRYIEFERHG